MTTLTLITASTTVASQHAHLYNSESKVAQQADFGWVERDEDWRAQGSIPAVWLE